AGLDDTPLAGDGFRRARVGRGVVPALRLGPVRPDAGRGPRARRTRPDRLDHRPQRHEPETEARSVAPGHRVLADRGAVGAPPASELELAARRAPARRGGRGSASDLEATATPADRPGGPARRRAGTRAAAHRPSGRAGGDACRPRAALPRVA